MSGVPAFLNEIPHVSGTTWAGFTLKFENADGTPIDLTGADARMVGRDADGTIVFDWHLSDPEKPGLVLTDNVLYVNGPGVLTLTEGQIRFDIKVWFATGEVAVDVAGVLPVISGVTP